MLAEAHIALISNGGLACGWIWGKKNEDMQPWCPPLLATSNA